MVAVDGRAYVAVDGRIYKVGFSGLRRLGSIVDGENAGRVLSGAMKRDIIGTYYNYELSASPLLGELAEYDAFYEVLSAPVDSHLVEVPYAQGTLKYRAYITNLSDNLVKARPGLNRWKGLTVNFIAMEPQRRPT